MAKASTLRRREAANRSRALWTQVLALLEADGDVETSLFVRRLIKHRYSLSPLIHNGRKPHAR